MSHATQTSAAANETCKEWARSELGGAGLGDARLDERLVTIAASFLSSPQSSIPHATGSWVNAKATYRFLDNKKVEPGIIYTRHRDSILPRVEGNPVVLAIADTTMLDYTSHPETEGLGPLGDIVHHGMLFHPTLLMTPQQVPLGVIDAQTWTRDIDAFGKGKAKPKSREAQEKESQKWLGSMEAAEKLQADIGGETQVVSVFDREGDTYDVLATACLEGRNAQLLVRAQADRRLQHPQQKLWSQLEAKSVASTVAINVPRKKGQKTRSADLSIRFEKVTVKPPATHLKSEGYEPVDAYAVYANEDSAPAGCAPVSWMLLTTVPVESAEDAWKIVEWYSCRWLIEILFKVLKSGCNAEERQLETADRLRRCLALDVVVAWRILYLTMVGRDTPDLPCSVIFDDYEWKGLWVFVFKSTDAVPDSTPTLREVTRTIGRLGGHLGRKGDGEPGVLSMWRGLQRLPDIAEMWKVFDGRE